METNIAYSIPLVLGVLALLAASSLACLRWRRGAARWSAIALALTGAAFVTAMALCITSLRGDPPMDAGPYHPTAVATLKWFSAGAAGASQPDRTSASERSGDGFAAAISIAVDNLGVLALALITFCTLAARSLTITGASDPARERAAAGHAAITGLVACTAALGAVAGDLLTLLLAWELTSLCAWLLIATSPERAGTRYAAGKTGAVLLAGDAALVTGLLIIGVHAGSFSITSIMGDVLGRESVGPWLPAASVLIVIGVAARSALVPLHIWLIEGADVPPAARTILAGLVPASGLVLIARLYPMLDSVAADMLEVSGALTALLGAALACAYAEPRRAAGSIAMAQFGFTAFAFGVGGYSSGVFALLIGTLTATAVTAAESGAARRAPGTVWRRLLLGIPLLAAAGAPLTAGFLARDRMLSAAWAYGRVADQWKSIGTAQAYTPREMQGTALADACLVAAFVASAAIAYAAARLFLRLSAAETGPSDSPSGAGATGVTIERAAGRRLETFVAAMLALGLLWLPYGLEPLNAAGGWALRRWMPVEATGSYAAMVGRHFRARPHEREGAVNQDEWVLYRIRVDPRLGGRYGEPLEQDAALRDDGGIDLSGPILMGLIVTAMPAAYLAHRRGSGASRAAKAVLWFDQNIINGAYHLVRDAWAAVGRGLVRFEREVPGRGVRVGRAGVRVVDGLLEQLGPSRLQLGLAVMVIAIVILFFLVR